MRTVAVIGGLSALGVLSSTEIGPLSVPPESIVAPDPADAWAVADVVDGDTIDIEHGGVVLRVRMIGINAPEKGECWATEAAAALADELVDGVVWLDSDVSDLDRYGRLLRYLVDERGDDIGERLVADGHAIARSYPPDTAHDERYAAAQRHARDAGLGLWASDACGDAPTGSAASGPAIAIEIRPDAAGDDNVNLNDEWVRFINLGDDPLDLSGWTVADESATNRYRFDELVVAPGESVTLFTGCGVDTASERYWCNADSAVWNNSGDTVFLRDRAGNVVASLTYVDCDPICRGDDE